MSAWDGKTGTYDERFYLDEFMEWGVMRLFELFADVEKVDLRPGHHDADESPVVSAQTLRGMWWEMIWYKIDTRQSSMKHDTQSQER